MGSQPLILVDTHVLVWMRNGDQRLGPDARSLYDLAAQEMKLAISAITPWEIALLAQKGRLPLGRAIGEWLELAIEGMLLAPLTPPIAVDANTLPGELHWDPADRIIVATARALKASLLTADSALLAYGRQGHVSVIDASR